MSMPSSSTPEGTVGPGPLCSGLRRGLPRKTSASALPEYNVSELYLPACSLGPLRFTVRVAPRGARAGLPGGGLLPGQDLLDLLVLLLFAHLLPPAGLPAHRPCVKFRRPQASTRPQCHHASSI